MYTFPSYWNRVYGPMVPGDPLWIAAGVERRYPGLKSGRAVLSHCRELVGPSILGLPLYSLVCENVRVQTGVDFPKMLEGEIIMRENAAGQWVENLGGMDFSEQDAAYLMHCQAYVFDQREEYRTYWKLLRDWRIPMLAIKPTKNRKITAILDTMTLNRKGHLSASLTRAQQMQRLVNLGLNCRDLYDSIGRYLYETDSAATFSRSNDRKPGEQYASESSVVAYSEINTRTGGADISFESGDTLPQTNVTRTDSWADESEFASFKPTRGLWAKIRPLRLRRGVEQIAMWTESVEQGRMDGWEKLTELLVRAKQGPTRDVGNPLFACTPRKRYSSVQKAHPCAPASHLDGTPLPREIPRLPVVLNTDWATAMVPTGWVCPEFEALETDEQSIIRELHTLARGIHREVIDHWSDKLLPLCEALAEEIVMEVYSWSAPLVEEINYSLFKTTRSAMTHFKKDGKVFARPPRMKATRKKVRKLRTEAWEAKRAKLSVMRVGTAPEFKPSVEIERLLRTLAQEEVPSQMIGESGSTKAALARLWEKDHADLRG